jgi:hypothetical protein
LEGETVWLTQQDMAELFQTTRQCVGQHLKKIFEEGELGEISVVKNFFTTAADGKRHATNFYNLDAIISVGYRVKSAVGTRFRIWATGLCEDGIGIRKLPWIPNPRSQTPATGMRSSVAGLFEAGMGSQHPITPNRLDRTTLQRLLTDRDLGRADRLASHIGVTRVGVPHEYIGDPLAAEVAIDALVIDVVASGNIVRVSVVVICHGARYGDGAGDLSRGIR